MKSNKKHLIMTVNQRVAGSSPASRAKGKAISNGCFFYGFSPLIRGWLRFDASIRAQLREQS